MLDTGQDGTDLRARARAQGRATYSTPSWMHSIPICPLVVPRKSLMQFVRIHHTPLTAESVVEW